MNGDKEDTRTYAVVMNDEVQCSIWHDGTEIPPGLARGWPYWSEGRMPALDQGKSGPT